VLRLDRPTVLNALTAPMLQDLADGIRRFGAGESSGGVILTGTGRAFSSGDDLKETEDLSRRSFARLIEAFQDVTRAIGETTSPVVAAVNGIAVGGAAEIACACDLRVGCPTSEFLFPENGLGITISNGSSVTLPGLVGRRAVGLVLLGQRIRADRAEALGLIDLMVERDGALMDRAVEVVQGLRSDATATALHLALLRPDRHEIERALQRELDLAMEAWDRGWPQEGIRRFMVRRGRTSVDAAPDADP
jgi:enoyl-CoA hydratase